MKTRQISRLASPLMAGLLGSALLACGGNSTTEPPSTLLAATAASDQCAAWSAAAVYTAGQCAVYDGKVYRAKWWVQGTAPNNDQWGPWSLDTATPTPTPTP
ncbi:carbohydrate-binding protein, partial [Janthinobacterium lividum]|uniref:carbohydrate-binding protein n=3 Tax=Janthinobacterium TaxID=29580 RepID=UPI000AB8AEA5